MNATNSPIKTASIPNGKVRKHFVDVLIPGSVLVRPTGQWTGENELSTSSEEVETVRVRIFLTAHSRLAILPLGDEALTYHAYTDL